MSEGFSQHQGYGGSAISMSNYKDYRLDKQQENEFHSVSKIYNEKMIKNIEGHKKMNMFYNYLVKNNQVIPQKQNNKKIQKVRKTRKDKDGRKHICGACKLGYLSYPALYTHIKTKHDGIRPEGTITGQGGKTKKRGRPKNRVLPQIYGLDQQKNVFPAQLISCVKRQNLRILDEFDFQINQDDDNLNNLQTKYFLETLRQIKKQEKPVLKLMRIQQLITVFLYNCREFFDKDALLSFQELFYELIIFVNIHYATILRDFQAQSDLYVDIDECYPDFKTQRLKSEHQLNYSSCEAPQFLPYFIQIFIKKNIEQDEQEKKLILIDFANWLYQNKLTSLKLDKNRADALM